MLLEGLVVREAVRELVERQMGGKCVLEGLVVACYATCVWGRTARYHSVDA